MVVRVTFDCSFPFTNDLVLEVKVIVFSLPVPWRDLNGYRYWLLFVVRTAVIWASETLPVLDPLNSGIAWLNGLALFFLWDIGVWLASFKPSPLLVPPSGYPSSRFLSLLEAVGCMSDLIEWAIRSCYYSFSWIVKIFFLFFGECSCFHSIFLSPVIGVELWP